MAQSERSAAGALVARLSLLVLNLVLFSLGVTLLVMSTQKSHYTDLMKTVYAEGGVTVEAFEQPDAALTLAGFFITFVSLQVRSRRRTRPKRARPLSKIFPDAPSPPKSDTEISPAFVFRGRAPSARARDPSRLSCRTTLCVCSSSPASSTAPK